MNSDTARQLFEAGGILLVHDAPKEMEFGIDMYSWQIGPQFQGIKMIPPGIHYCYYSERDLLTRELSNRQSLFIEIKQSDQMLIVLRWSSTENLFQREQLTSAEYEIRRNQRYEFDHLLGQYPLDTYRQWLALSNHLRYDFLEKLCPLNGHICSANVFDVNEYKKGQKEDFSIPKNLTEAESRLPKMTLNTQFAFRFTMIETKTHLYSGADLTQSKLDRTIELEKLIAERFDGNIYGLLCELQLSFNVFFLGHLYDGFEQWKCLFHFICSCQKAFCRWPIFYIDFLQTIYFQLKHFVHDSATGEHFFVDIDQQENYIYKSLENLFVNITAFNDNQQMEGNDSEKLIERCGKMKLFLNETYKWTFDDEPDDEKPIVVELEN
jgi:A1 cistron-splicing factor AAR2